MSKMTNSLKLSDLRGTRGAMARASTHPSHTVPMERVSFPPFLASSNPNSNPSPITLTDYKEDTVENLFNNSW